MDLTLEQLLAKAHRADEIKEQRKRTVYKYRQANLEQEQARHREYARIRAAKKKAKKAEALEEKHIIIN